MAPAMGRFAEADLASILDHHASTPGTGQHTGPRRATEDASLTQGTRGWARLGASPDGPRATEGEESS